MNILYLLFSFTTGGTERLVTDICNEMIVQGHHVHLYIVNDLYDETMINALNPKVQLYLQKRPVGSGGKLQTIFRLAQYIHKHKFDVIHCNSADAPELLILKPLMFPKTKVLYTIHSMNCYNKMHPLRIFYRNLLCHRLIAVSDSVRQEMLSSGAKKEKLITVYNAVNMHRFVQPSDRSLNTDKVVLGNVARLDYRTKGQDILIRALGILQKQHPNIHCIFAGTVGQGQEQNLKDLQDLAKQCDLSDRITFLGNVNDIPGFLRTLDIFVLPSRSEAFGISLVEAMAMGVPCIASRLDGPVEVLKSGQLGLLFDADNPRDLANKIKTMLDSYDRFKTAALENTEHVRKQYDISTMCRQLEQYMR